VVSAASICAKVTRDHLLENWKFAEEASGAIKIDNNFGCGYPGDTNSKKWLQD
jgi:ribonuclease H2 subunit A